MRTKLRESISELRRIAETVGDPEAAMLVESLDAADALGLLPVQRLVDGTSNLTQEKLDAITHWIYEGYWQSCENPLVQTVPSLLQSVAKKAVLNPQRV